MENFDNTNRNSKCWVPVCSATTSRKTTLLSLPSNIKARELWLALAGRPKYSSSFEEILFCGEHFSSSDIMEHKGLNITNGLPLLKMPEKICRTCMKIIPQNELFHVISNTTTTDMPSCIPDMIMYFTSNSPLPLSFVLNKIIPEMEIKFDPPPLICNSCFVDIWLYYMFTLSCIEVEKTLKDDISIEVYRKMVLCRSCPRTFGTVFIDVDQSTSMGVLLKNIFKQKDKGKEPLPLRLCLTCHNVLKKIDAFRNTCLLAEEKLQRHFALEREIAERKKRMTILPQMALGEQDKIKDRLKSAGNLKFKKELRENNCSDSIRVDCAYINPILTERWKKEELAKTFLQFADKFKNNEDEKKIHFLIHKKLQKLGILCKINEIKSAWQILIKNTESKCDRKLPLECLDELILKYINECPEKNDNGPGRKENISVKKENISVKKENSVKKDNRLAKKDDNDASTSGSLPQTKDNKPVIDKKGSKNIQSSKMGIVERYIEFVSAFEKEYNVFYNRRKQTGENAIFSFRGILKQVYKKNKRYQQNYTFPSFYSKVHYARSSLINQKHEKAKIFSEILKKENIYQRNRIHGAIRKVSKLNGNPIKKIKLPLKKTVQHVQSSAIYRKITLTDKMTLIREVQNEYDSLKKKDQVHLRTPRPWRFIIKRLASKKVLESDFDRLYSLWNRLKTSARIHEKDGADIVDVEMWKLLELHKNYVQTFSSGSSEKRQSKENSGNVPSTSDRKMQVDQKSDDSSDDDTSISSSPKEGTSSDDDKSKDTSVDIKPILEIQAPLEFQQRSEVTESDNKNVDTKTHKKEKGKWSEEDKLKVFKLIKNEYISMARNNKSPKKIPWATVLKSLVNKGSSVYAEKDLVYMWSLMKSNVMLHENTDQMTLLDWKVWRLLRKAKGMTIPKDSAPEVDTKPSLETSPNVILKWTRQQKLDLLDLIKETGNSIFKKYPPPQANPVWDIIYEKYKNKGYNIPKNKVKSFWAKMKRSALLAMADQKMATTFDRIIIDFMKDVASTKIENISSIDKICDDNQAETDNISNDDTNDSDSLNLNYEFVSKQDIEVIDQVQEFEQVHVKSEVPKGEFKEEPNLNMTDDEVIDLCDDDEDDIFED